MDLADPAVFEFNTFILKIVGKYLELTPIFVVGLIAGFLNCLHNNKWSKYEFFKGITTSCFLALITYGLLLAIDIPYLTRVSIAGLVGFLGFENSISFIERILTLIRTHKKQP